MSPQVRIVLKRAALLAIDFVSVCLAPLYWLWGFLPSSKRVCVLAYHKTTPEASARRDEWNVHPERFKHQIALLKRMGFEVMSASQLVKAMDDWGSLPRRVVSITFDDGYHNNFAHAFPALKEAKMPATFFLASAYLDQEAGFPWQRELVEQRPFTRREIGAMRAEGIEFFSHSHSHADFSKMSKSEMKRDLRASVEALKPVIGGGPHAGFACPFGVWGPAADSLIQVLKEENFAWAFLGRWGLVKANSTRYDLPRLTIYGGDGTLVFLSKIIGSFEWLGIVHYAWHRIRSRAAGGD